MTPPSSKRAVVAFVAAIGTLWLLFTLIAVWTPIVLDDWYQVGWHRVHEFGLHSILSYARYNYFNYNPRIGDTLLLIVNGPKIIHCVATPLVEVGLLFVTFAMAFARWPKPTSRDLHLLIVAQACLWLIAPVAGVMYFYRPFTTNYLYAFCFQLSLFVPFRFELARPTRGPNRWWLCPILLGWGWVAGMTNEHTGPTALVAMIALLVLALRTHRVRPWMWAAAIGLFIGYPMLYFAPGQALRYGGLATKSSPLALIAERGFDGNFEILLSFVAESQFAIVLMLLGLVIAARRARNQHAALPTMGRARVLTLCAFLIAAFMMVATMFASPVVGERLFFAPTVLVVAGLLVATDALFEQTVARCLLVAIAAGVVIFHAVRFVVVYHEAKIDNDARIALLAKAPAGSIVEVPPYRNYKRTRWFWGDDFQYASLREYIAHEVYDLGGIEVARLDGRPHWVEPTPPERFTDSYTYAPPLDDAAVTASGKRPTYVPTYWEWAVGLHRKAITLRGLGDIDGHHLMDFTVDAHLPAQRDGKPIDYSALRGRPVRVVDWRSNVITFVDGRRRDDVLGWPYLLVWKPTIPPGWTDAYVLGCGALAPVNATMDDEGLRLPFRAACPGTYIAIVCQADLCWHAGRYWR